MSRFIRYLRIAFSVVCVILCLLLIALWIRSYNHNDVLRKNTRLRILFLNSWKGRLTYWPSVWEPNPRVPLTNYAEAVDEIIQGGSHPVLGFGIVYTHGGLNDTIVFAPYWFPVLSFAVLAAIAWFPWQRRFSLRTLLIATTLMAVALGTIVWSSR
jgi:hypothetical protein